MKICQNKKIRLIGRDIEYSFSKQYFSTKFKKENRTAINISMDIKKVEDFKKIKLKEFDGFNVTIFAKEKIINFQIH